MFGIMADCSRNGVLRPETVKDIAAKIKAMGYDTLMLYCEDTYEIDGEPLFGYLRGRYTKDELRDIDRYCAGIGIELVPCIQTLAHLNGYFHWYDNDAINDCDDILLIDEPKTYELIERMFKSAAECFTSRRIHIGMDEAYRVGLGKFEQLHGRQDRFDIINRHLHKVCSIAEKYGFSPMIWHDMFVRLARNTTEKYGADGLDEVRRRAALPENISLVYWDYYHDKKEDYLDSIHLNRAFDRPVVFAGGAWTWMGFAPGNGFSIDRTAAALDACRGADVKDVFITLWGDDGDECSIYSAMPTLAFAAAKHFGITDYKEYFYKVFGVSFDDVMLLDSPNHIGGKHQHNPSKYLLYNDPFLGINDFRVGAGDNEYFAKCARRLNSVTNRGIFARQFDTLTALCDLLSVKAQLGVKTRKYYKSGDMAALKMLAETDYTAAIERLDKFYDAYRAQWVSDNKPHGFDVQDMRLGGLKQRLTTCKARLNDYCDGRCARIEELDEEILPTAFGAYYKTYSTPNVIYH